MTDLNTRLRVNNSKHLADEGKSLAISDILTSDDLRFRIDNSKDSMDNFRSISLGQIKSILSDEVVLGFDEKTRIVIDNSGSSAHDGRTVLIEDVISLVTPDVGGGDYVGPFDIVPGAIFGYSQRALAAAWVSDVITIREDNGDTTMSFATTTNNAVDAAAVTTFLNGANGCITKLFDQSGNGVDLVQASTPAQPQWYGDGPNSTPYLGIAGVNAQGSLASSNTMTLVTGWTSFHVLNMPIPPVTHNPHILSFVGDDQAYIDAWIEQIGKLWGDFTGDQFANEAARLAASNNSVPVAEWVIVEYVVETGSFHILVNGVDIALATEVGDGVFGTLTNLITTLFFAYDSDAILNRAEDVAWGSALSAPDRLAIRQNIAAYRGITLA